MVGNRFPCEFGISHSEAKFLSNSHPKEAFEKVTTIIGRLYGSLLARNHCKADPLLALPVRRLQLRTRKHSTASGAAVPCGNATRLRQRATTTLGRTARRSGEQAQGRQAQLPRARLPLRRRLAFVLPVVRRFSRMTVGCGGSRGLFLDVPLIGGSVRLVRPSNAGIGRGVAGRETLLQRPHRGCVQRASCSTWRFLFRRHRCRSLARTPGETDGCGCCDLAA